MPHYVFVCKECETEFEKTLHVEELKKVPVECPNCNSTQVEQLIAAFSAITSKKS